MYDTIFLARCQVCQAKTMIFIQKYSTSAMLNSLQPLMDSPDLQTGDQKAVPRLDED